jgi:uncharacterized protein YfiM (DUF2279 family)
VNACLLVLCLSLSGGAEAVDAWFAEDKFKHFFTSFAVTALAASGARAAGLDASRSLAAGVAVGAGAGIWKELRDQRVPGGHFSVRDLVWDFAGVGAAAAVVSQAR